MELKPRYVGKDILLDYAGMNPATAKIFGFTDIADSESLILNGMSESETEGTIKHEQDEYDLINQGKSYWEAHGQLIRQEAKSVQNLIRKSVDIKRKDGKIIISTISPDRGGDRVNPKGGHFENYMKNPVIMWLHDYRGITPAAGIPIARCPGLTVTDSDIISEEPQFLDGDPFAERVKNAWQKGFIKTASIGFAPLSDPKTNEFNGYDFDDWELLEWSLVPIPMNAEAMRVAKSMGIEDLIDKQIITKPEETENFIRVPVPGEGGDKHKDHRIRTIDISAKEGISGLYCGECKVVITYLFDKDKGWTMAKAEKWVKDHEKSIQIQPEVITPTVKSMSQAELADEMDYITASICEVGISKEIITIAQKLSSALNKRLPGGDIPVEIDMENLEILFDLSSKKIK